MIDIINSECSLLPSYIHTVKIMLKLLCHVIRDIFFTQPLILVCDIHFKEAGALSPLKEYNCLYTTKKIKVLLIFHYYHFTVWRRGAGFNQTGVMKINNKKSKIKINVIQGK